MPKKRFNNLKSFQGGSSGKQARDGNNASPSVNERLSELRRLEGKDAIQKKRELAESSSHQATVHPSLNNILGISESAPPKPKRGIRTRNPNRTPGPAPPKSWGQSTWTPVLALRGGRRFGKVGRANDERSRPKQLLRFGRLTGLEPNVADAPPTLLHLALKTAASQWELFEDDDLPVLAAELPLPLRLKLLSYLGYYGPPINTNVLDALTGGSEHVSSMDLTGLAGHGKLTLQRIVKLSKQQSAEQTTSSAIADSWDEDATLEASLSSSLSASRFSQLTYLSLSHPPTGISWRDLLSFTKQTPCLTHLSLAYWPRPTLTPNLATTTVVSQHSPEVTAGGSHFYSALDRDMNEPASILRQLSANLLYLQWLDLEGCTEWIPALAFHTDIPLATTGEEDASTTDPWSRQATMPSIFSTTWENVALIRVGQGWLPTIPGLRALPRQTMATAKRQVLDDYTGSFDPFELRKAELDEADVFGVQKRQADVWLELEERVITAARKINTIRRVQACKPVVFDHGWLRKAF